MKLARVLIYAIILAVVAGYVYMVEIRQKEKQEAAQKKADKLFHLDHDKINRILIDGPKKGPIELKKLSDTWVMTSPVKAKADEGAVNAMLTTLSMASREKLLSEKDVAWKDYGLEPPAFTATAWTKDKKTSLKFGGKNPSKTSYYARLDDEPELLMVQDTLKNALNKTPFNLRDKSIVNIAPQDVDSLAITKSGKETEFKREKAGKWAMTKPERIRVKSDVLNRTLRDITNLTATEIIDDPKKAGDPYGLQNPSELIVLSGSKLDQTLVVGRPKKNEKGSEKAYVRIKGRGTVYSVSARHLDVLKTDPKELRDRSLFSMNPADIDKLEIDFQGGKWELSRGKDGNWQMIKPEKKDALASWPVTSLLWSVKGLQWKSLEKLDAEDLSRFHLVAPKLTVRLHVKDAKEPIILKAGWVGDSPKKDSQVPRENAQSAGQNDAKPQPDSDASTASTSDSKKEAEEKSPEADRPEKVYATVTPHPDKGVIFVLEPKFLESLSTDLKKLSESK